MSSPARRRTFDIEHEQRGQYAGLFMVVVGACLGVLSVLCMFADVPYIGHKLMLRLSSLVVYTILYAYAFMFLYPYVFMDEGITVLPSPYTTALPAKKIKQIPGYPSLPV